MRPRKRLKSDPLSQWSDRISLTSSVMSRTRHLTNSTSVA